MFKKFHLKKQQQRSLQFRNKLIKIGIDPINKNLKYNFVYFPQFQKFGEKTKNKKYQTGL